MTPLVLLLMGVSGSGKTTIAEHLAHTLGWVFQEGDSLHPAANVEKMRRGEPLDDLDRAPWLAIVARWVTAQVQSGVPGIITCSALKQRYRAQIKGGDPRVKVVYLHGTPAVLRQHLTGRRHEFMPTTLLDSQLATLEEPGPDENVLEVEVDGSVEETVSAILSDLELSTAAVARP